LEEIEGFGITVIAGNYETDDEDYIYLNPVYRQDAEIEFTLPLQEVFPETGANCEEVERELLRRTKHLFRSIINDYKKVRVMEEIHRKLKLEK